MAPLNGIDVSSHQPARIAGLVPADFVIVKSTGGTWYTNPLVREQLDVAGSVGIKRLGAYHFAHEGAKQSAALEAEAFLQRTPYLDEGVLPVLDWEDGDVSDVGWAYDWCDRVGDATGTTPLLYCNLSVATSYDWSRVQALGVKLWLAWYGNDAQVNGYTVPSLFETEDVVAADGWLLALWQYTQHGRLPGYAGNLDLNVAYEDVWASDAPGKLLVPGVPLP